MRRLNSLSLREVAAWLLAMPLVLAGCGGTTAATGTATAQASRPIIISSTSTPGGNPVPVQSGPADPNSTVLTPYATNTPSSPTAVALLTAVASTPANQVKIVDFTFDPPVLNGTVGQTITWTNTGPSNHTVTANDGSFDSGTIQVNAKFTFTPTKAGTFLYHCSIHPTMQGTLVIK